MTYKEQLLSQEWLEKRKIILGKENNICQQCYNKSYGEKYSQGIVFESSINSQNHGYRVKIWDLKTNKIVNSLIRHVAFSPAENYVCFYEQSNNYFHIIALKKINRALIELNSPIEVVRQGIKGRVSEMTYNEIYRPIDKNDVWPLIFGLHIHHRYYQRGLLAWQYPSEALVTLCWECHEQLHKESKVPVLNEHGIEIEKFNYCKRCHGAAIFPEYSHIQSGICFRCDGAKYEELIANR